MNSVSITVAEPTLGPGTGRKEKRKAALLLKTVYRDIVKSMKVMFDLNMYILYCYMYIAT